MRPVAILQPPASLTNRAPCLDDGQFGLGILALAAFLEAHGVPVSAIHVPLALREGQTFAEVIATLQRLDPLLVAIGLNWVHFSRGALQIARAVRAALPRVPIVLGGQHATLFAGEIVRDYGDAVDAVIVGEAELPLLAAARSAAETGRIAAGSPGLRLTADEAITAPEVVADIDALPMYSYRSMRPGPKDPRAGALSTVRGACPHRCAYCVEPVIGRAQGRPRLTFHSPEYVAEQMARLTKEGVDRFTIQDGLFVGGDRMLVRLVEAMAARGLRPSHLNVFAHPESFGPEGFAALAGAADLATVDFGVETGAPEVARRAERPGECDRVLGAVADARHAGVVPYTWWLVGLPGEDEVTQQETRNLLLASMRAGGIPRWVSTLVLLPGTPMHERAPAYGTSPRFHTFEDYAVFSDTTLAEALHFPDLITHTTLGSTPDDILRESASLRRFILDHFSELDRVYGERSARTADLAAARRTIASSFF